MNNMKNKVQLIGHLGLNPEVKTIQNGTKLAKMRMATSEVYKNNRGEKVTDTEWHNIVAWGKTAEIAEQILRKGSEVMVEGKLIHREYTDKDGNKRYATEVQVVNLLLLDRKAASA